MVENKNKPPIENLNIRGVKVAVWEHSINDKDFRQITIKRSYKDEDGNYHDTDSLRINDIPNLIVALQEVYKKEVFGDYKE